MSHNPNIDDFEYELPDDYDTCPECGAPTICSDSPEVFCTKCNWSLAAGFCHTGDLYDASREGAIAQSQLQYLEAK